MYRAQKEVYVICIPLSKLSKDISNDFWDNYNKLEMAHNLNFYLYSKAMLPSSFLFRLFH